MKGRDLVLLALAIFVCISTPIEAQKYSCEVKLKKMEAKPVKEKMTISQFIQEINPEAAVLPPIPENEKTIKVAVAYPRARFYADFPDGARLHFSLLQNKLVYTPFQGTIGRKLKGDYFTEKLLTKGISALCEVSDKNISIARDPEAVFDPVATMKMLSYGLYVLQLSFDPGFNPDFESVLGRKYYRKHTFEFPWYYGEKKEIMLRLEADFPKSKKFMRDFENLLDEVMEMGYKWIEEQNRQPPIIGRTMEEREEQMYLPGELQVSKRKKQVEFVEKVRDLQNKVIADASLNQYTATAGYILALFDLFEQLPFEAENLVATEELGYVDAPIETYGMTPSQLQKEIKKAGLSLDKICFPRASAAGVFAVSRKGIDAKIKNILVVLLREYLIWLGRYLEDDFARIDKAYKNLDINPHEFLKIAGEIKKELASYKESIKKIFAHITTPLEKRLCQKVWLIRSETDEVKAKTVDDIINDFELWIDLVAKSLNWYEMQKLSDEEKKELTKKIDSLYQELTKLISMIKEVSMGQRLIELEYKNIKAEAEKDK